MDKILYIFAIVMATLIKNVQERNIVEFDRGTFDDWCVFLTRPAQLRYAPKDTEYFSFFIDLASRHGTLKVYNDFIRIYNSTKTSIDEPILKLITQIANTYNGEAEEVDIWFTIIYSGMVAEENKQYAILKKRVKRLGIHQILFNVLSPYEAANFARGKKWRELDVIMKSLGF